MTDSKLMTAKLRTTSRSRSLSCATCPAAPQPNLTRTLAKLEAVGFVRMRTVERRKVVTTAIHKLRVEIDPFSQNDRLELA